MSSRMKKVAAPVAAAGKPSRARADAQLSGLAGEFFVAAELLRRGHQVAVTMGNAKSIDLFVHNARSGGSFTVQVKSLRSTNAFLISPKSIRRGNIYVFVVLNKPEERPTYFIVPGDELADRPRDFWPRPDEKLPGFMPKHLASHRDAWSIFGPGEYNGATTAEGAKSSDA
jgi:hypothetical protein